MPTSSPGRLETLNGGTNPFSPWTWAGRLPGRTVQHGFTLRVNSLKYPGYIDKQRRVRNKILEHNPEPSSIHRREKDDSVLIGIVTATSVPSSFRSVDATLNISQSEPLLSNLRVLDSLSSLLTQPPFRRARTNQGFLPGAFQVQYSLRSYSRGSILPPDSRTVNPTNPLMAA